MKSDNQKISEAYKTLHYKMSLCFFWAVFGSLHLESAIMYTCERNFSYPKIIILVLSFAGSLYGIFGYRFYSRKMDSINNELDNSRSQTK